jgi:hypothetical protein
VAITPFSSAISFHFVNKLSCFLTGMFPLPNCLSHGDQRRLCSGSAHVTSGLLKSTQVCLGLHTLFTRHGVVKTYLTRNHQLLTSGPKRPLLLRLEIPDMLPTNTETVIQEVVFLPFKFHLPAAYSKNGRLVSPSHLSTPIPSSLPSSLPSFLPSFLLSLLSLRVLSHPSSKDLSFSFSL